MTPAEAAAVRRVLLRLRRTIRSDERYWRGAASAGFCVIACRAHANQALVDMLAVDAELARLPTATKAPRAKR